MKLSEKIVRLRKSRGMTQEEMVERCAVTRQSISKWEADIALPETEKLSAALCKGDDPKDNWFADFKAGDRKLSSFTERCSLIQSETKRRKRAFARLAGRWAYRMSRCTGKSENRNLSFFDCIAAGGKMRYTGHEVSKNEPDDAL